MLQHLFFQFSYYRKPPWDTGISPPELFEFIESHPPGRAIDLGCGTGTNVITLARAGWDVTGVDFAPRAIHLANRNIQAANVKGELAVDDATKLNGISGPFDLALDIGCFHSLGGSARLKYLEKLYLILAPDRYWLLYGFFKQDAGQAPPGLVEADIDRITDRLTLVSRQDGIDRGERRSAWFLFRKTVSPT